MAIEKKSAFARRLGVAPSYVTKLLQAGRLVSVGKCIDVESSLALIKMTADPNRDDVRARHAAGRDGKKGAQSTGTPSAPSESAEAGKQTLSQKAGKKSELKAATVFREARANRMHYQARKAELKVARLRGELVDISKIRHCADADAGMIKTLLGNLPDQVAPRLAAVNDEELAARIICGLFDDIEQTMMALLDKNKPALHQRPEPDGDAD